jgi:4-aminobutyrate aminotransferase/(S)-3-amino-2-methylpropionate transaminase
MDNQPTNKDLNDLRTRYMPPALSSGTSCYVASAKGSLVYDVEGREYIDFAGGIGVMNVGHSHPKVVAAIKNQAENLTHSCFMVLPYEPAVRLSEKLCTIVPGDFPKTAIFVNSGAEAVENAVKIARYHTKKTGIIAFEHSFHGRTQLAMSLTSKVKPYKFGFGPYAPEIYRMQSAYCYRCPFNLQYPDCDVACADHLNEFLITHTAPETTAAVIAEPIQGEGGFITPPPEYFSKLAKICKDNEILFIADEIQSGTGRTGKMFAIEHYNVEPDIMTVAKSFAAGMPLASVVGKAEVMGSVHPYGVGGTYGANPVCCSAALAVMDIFEEENLMQQSQELGVKVRQRLDAFKEQFEIIGDVRGLGPMLALELVKDRETKAPADEEARAMVQACLEKGLVILACGTFGNVIRTLMPLNIGAAELDKGLAIMEEAFSEIAKK